MAWTEFYIDTGGNSSDVNAGTGGANTAASVTNTNGNWSTATNIFTPSGGGTPFSGLTANVSWVSIYVDGATVTPFVGRVSAVNSGGATITIDTTVRLGTPPVTSATARSCKVGGLWASLAGMTAAAVLGAGTAGTSMRINVKAATYANTTSLRTMAAAGATTAPIWIRGYTTTPGDLDDVANAASRPELTFTTGRLTIQGAHTLLTNLNVTTTGAASNYCVGVTGSNIWVDCCRVDNQHANAASNAILVSTGTGLAVTNCYLKATTTATRVATITSPSTLADCYLVGGVSGVESTTAAVIRNCIIDSPTTNGVILPTTGSAGAPRVLHCTIYNTTNGINATTIVAGIAIEDCLFSTLTNGINNSSGTNTHFVKRHNNAFYAVTNQEVGFGDSPAFGAVTESSNPLTNAAGGVYAVVDGALARGTAAGRTFENLSGTVTFPDRGAVQTDAPTAAATATAMWTYGNRQLS